MHLIRDKTKMVNLVNSKFFEHYPKWHILKLLIDLNLNRHISYYIFLILFHIWFKPLHHIELNQKKNASNHKGNFLVVQNHSNYNDAILQLCIYAHLGYFLHTFTMETSFKPLATECTLAHFIEMIPRYGSGKSCVNRMVDSLLQGKIVSIFPAGSYPSGQYANTSLVQEPFTGAARVAYRYWKITNQPLIIQPSYLHGANFAYPPKKNPNITKKRSKIRMIFGEPFTLVFSSNPDGVEFNKKAKLIQMKIARLRKQKKLIPNSSRRMKSINGEESRFYQ